MGRPLRIEYPAHSHVTSSGKERKDVIKSQKDRVQFFYCAVVTTHQTESEAVMERVSVARMATAKLQGWIHAARGMAVSDSVSTKLNSYVP